MDVFELLKRDHMRLTALVGRLLDEQDMGLRKIAFSQLRTELVAHVEMEGALLYPLLERIGYDRVEDAYQSHHMMQRQMDAVERHHVGSSDWLDSVELLARTFDEHVRLDEEGLFPEIQQRLAPDHALQLGQESSRLKLELMGIRY